MTARERHPAAAFSLIELSIGMILSVVLIGLGYGVVTTLHRWVAAWEDALAVQFTAHRTVQHLNRLLAHAQALYPVDDSTWVVRTSAGQGGVLHYRHRELWLEGQVLHDREVRLEAFELNLPPAWEPYAPPEEAGGGRGFVEVTMTWQKRSARLTRATLVLVRPPRPWGVSGSDLQER